MVVVYDVYDGLAEKEIQKKDSVKEYIEKGVQSFHSGKYLGANTCFLYVASALPMDFPTEIYLNRCKEKLSKQKQ